MLVFVQYSRTAALAGMSALLMACTGPQDCTQVDIPAVVATILDATTNQPTNATLSGVLLAEGRQIPFQEHRTGESIQAYAEPGTYLVRLTALGYSTWDSTVSIRQDRVCGGALTANITVRLAAQ